MNWLKWGCPTLWIYSHSTLFFTIYYNNVKYTTNYFVVVLYRWIYKSFKFLWYNFDPRWGKRWPNCTCECGWRMTLPVFDLASRTTPHILNPLKAQSTNFKMICLCYWMSKVQRRLFLLGLKGAKSRNKFGDHDKHVFKYPGSHSGRSHHYSCCHLSRATKLHECHLSLIWRLLVFS